MLNLDITVLGVVVHISTGTPLTRASNAGRYEKIAIK